MKRRLEAIAIGVLFCFLAFACSSVKEQGISEYHKANSSTGITLFLLPDDNFLQEFSYVEGDYYCDAGLRLFPERSLDTAIMYLRYNDLDYIQAKTYCLEYMDLNIQSQYSYNDYIFVENEAIKKASNSENDYTLYFNAFVYNDKNNTLLFLGYFLHDRGGDEIKSVKAYFTENKCDEFLSEYFSFYSFEI